MAEPTDPVIATKTPKELIKRFYFQQDKIVKTYDQFEKRFGVYLATAPNLLYHHLVDEITHTFEIISHEIICIKAEMSDEHNLKALASLVDTFLDKEKCKLQLTVNLKLAEKDVQDNEGVESYVRKVRELKERMKGLQEEINEVLLEIKYEIEDIFEYNESAEGNLMLRNI